MIVSLCVCLSAIVSSELHVRSSLNFLRMLPMAVARSFSGGVVIRYVLTVMDDVMSAHKPRLLDVATQLKRNAHAALGLAINCAQQYQWQVNYGRMRLLYGRLK